MLVTRQLPAAVIVALAGKPLGPQQLIMLGEAKTPPQIFDKLADALGFERIAATPETSKAMTDAGVPGHIMVALAGMPLGSQQLVMLGEAKTPPEIFNKLGDTLGFEPVRATAESTKAMTEAGVPGDIIARMDKAAAEKELRDYESAHEAWEKEVAPYKKLYETILAAGKSGDKVVLRLPDMRELTAKYSDSPETYYIGGGKADGVESFSGPLWRIEISKPGFHFFSDPADVDVSLAIKNDGSGNVAIYRVEEHDRVGKTPIGGDLHSLAAALGIDLKADAVRPGP